MSAYPFRTFYTFYDLSEIIMSNEDTHVLLMILFHYVLSSWEYWTLLHVISIKHWEMSVHSNSCNEDNLLREVTLLSSSCQPRSTKGRERVELLSSSMTWKESLA